MNFKLSSPMLNSDGGGGGGGPISSPFTAGGGRPGQSQQNQNSSTDDLLAELTKEIRGTQQMVQQQGQRNSSLEKVIGGIKQAVGGEPDALPDWYEDEILPHLFELEKEGKSHPMTATLAKELKAAQLREFKLEERLQRIEQREKELSDPNTQSDDRAYSTMDDFITTELESVYGEASPNLHRAIGANIANDLSRIQKEFPEKWKEIRRNPETMQKIVAHHITLMIPPKAVSVMQKQQEDNTPISLSMVNQAIDEFHQTKHKMTPQQRSDVAQILRQQHLQLTYSENRRIPRRR
jgi:hypothetical protein